MCHPGSLKNCDPTGYTYQMFAIELFASFLYVTVVLNIKYLNGGTKENLINSLAIAICYYGLTLMTVNLTGGCLNPALAITQSIFQYFVMYTQNLYTPMTMRSSWIYFFAPVAGAILAGLWHRYDINTLLKCD